ncbi:MAG TPA: DUF2155 domain-containing protein [Caulobacteraceae bacterium]|nr:DUF2155 domain-containing protein [Caulobacteraceae bacterium]
MDPRLTRRWIAGGAVLVVLCAGLALAQPPPLPQVAPQTPAPPSLGPVVAPPPMADEAQSEPDMAEEKPKPKVVVPTGPPRPDRGPTAILRVLDKVTAETLRFEAPVGRRVRYKSLVFQVRACQTWAPESADPRPSAYVIIDADVGSAGGATGSRQVYKGWMFAKAPDVHALQHPLYDAWLESCEGAPAPTA